MWRPSISKMWPVLLVIALLASILPSAAAKENGKTSRPGSYSGYSEAVYDEWVRSSQYVEVRDGTKLAVDIFRPSVEGVPVDGPLPLVWTAERYRRAFYSGSYLVTTLDSSPYLTTLLQHGYVVASVDVRGTGASFGTWTGSGPTEAWDCYDMNEWFAAQPWCDGNVGMFGASYRGINQYYAAATAPPHLKCIFPEVACFDGYITGHPNGIFWDLFLKNYAFYNYYIDVLDPAVPVDEDADGSMLAAAIEQHKSEPSDYAMAQTAIFRNSWNPYTNDPVIVRSPDGYLNSVKGSGIAVYHWSGWFDYFVYTQPLWFANLNNPQKMTIGPWVHTDRGMGTEFGAVEHLRWYDYWLRGIDNGIMDEPPVYYYTMGAPAGQEWQLASAWPAPGMRSTNYYFGGTKSGSVDSLNDGLLSTKAPKSATGQDIYDVAYGTTVGLKDRWTAQTMADLNVDWTVLDEKSLTYTTAPLPTDMQITGYPVVHLWVSSTATDQDFFIYLEEVDENGVSTNTSDGLLRASYRAVSTAPWNNLGLPWHRCNSGDVEPLTPGEPVELAFALAPTSNLFDKGHRIRVTVTCADYADMFDTPTLDPAPTVTMYRNSEYASYITLPITQAGSWAHW